MTGRLPRPQPRSFGRWLLQAPSSVHLLHSANVTSYRPIAKGLSIVTRCTGRSYSAFDPIMNEPAGTTTISGQSAQARKVCPALNRVGAAVAADAGGVIAAGPGGRAGCGAGAAIAAGGGRARRRRGGGEAIAAGGSGAGAGGGAAASGTGARPGSGWGDCHPEGEGLK